MTKVALAGALRVNSPSRLVMMPLVVPFSNNVCTDDRFAFRVCNDTFVTLFASRVGVFECFSLFGQNDVLPSITYLMFVPLKTSSRSSATALFSASTLTVQRYHTFFCCIQTNILSGIQFWKAPPLLSAENRGYLLWHFESNYSRNMLGMLQTEEGIV